jgi:hypothetical protein
MKITIEKKESVEIEVQLPTYRKSKNHFYKLEENKTTCVYEGIGSYSIEVNEYCMKFPFEFEECTENDFNEMYNQVKNKL